jgi:hypothetical protein
MRRLPYYCLALSIAIAGTSGAGATTITASTQWQTPPPAPEERLPTPPCCGAVTWLPGHWRSAGIAGTEWQWDHGHYVTWPPAGTTLMDEAPSSPNRRVGIEGEAQ